MVRKKQGHVVALVIILIVGLFIGIILDLGVILGYAGMKLKQTLLISVALSVLIALVSVSFAGYAGFLSPVISTASIQGVFFFVLIVIFSALEALIGWYIGRALSGRKLTGLKIK